MGAVLLVACAACSTPAAHRSPASAATASPALPSPTTPTSASSDAATGSSDPATLPRPDHTVVVIMENHSYADVVSHSQAPWLNSLPAAVLTDWHGVTHPSQPNYLALFTGSTQGVTDDRCPVQVDGPNLADQLTAAGMTFTGYSEGLPAMGSTVCSAGDYVRRHNPWADFEALPATTNRPLTEFPSDFSALPTVAFVVPDLCHDTHNCPTAQGDRWLTSALGPYVTWASTHNSLLVVTYDEDDDQADNHIPTYLVGPMVIPGGEPTHGDHYTLLRTLEALCGLPGIGQAASVRPLTGTWR